MYARHCWHGTQWVLQMTPSQMFPCWPAVTAELQTGWQIWLCSTYKSTNDTNTNISLLTEHNNIVHEQDASSYCGALTNDTSTNSFLLTGYKNMVMLLTIVKQYELQWVWERALYKFMQVIIYYYWTICTSGGVYVYIICMHPVTVFTCMPGERYCRWLRSLLLCLCDVF